MTELNRDDLQRSVLGEHTRDNPKLPQGPLPMGRALLTNNDIITLAINEILSGLNTTTNTTSNALTSFQNIAIGNYIDNIDIETKLNEMNGTLIEIVHTLYSMIVGDIKNPVHLEGNASINDTIKTIMQQMANLNLQTTWGSISDKPDNLRRIFYWDGSGSIPETVDGDIIIEYRS